MRETTLMVKKTVAVFPGLGGWPLSPEAQKLDTGPADVMVLLGGQLSMVHQDRKPDGGSGSTYATV